MGIDLEGRLTREMISDVCRRRSHMAAELVGSVVAMRVAIANHFGERPVLGIDGVIAEAREIALKIVQQDIRDEKEMLRGLMGMEEESSAANN